MARKNLSAPGDGRGFAKVTVAGLLYAAVVTL